MLEKILKIVKTIDSCKFINQLEQTLEIINDFKRIEKPKDDIIVEGLMKAYRIKRNEIAREKEFPEETNKTEWIYAHDIELFKKSDMEKPIGSKGKIVDLFNKELTKEEWNALAIVHKMRLRLNLGIQFNWCKTIDVKSENYSQIVDESVFMNKSNII